jgi:hypothetical protein
MHITHLIHTCTPSADGYPIHLPKILPQNQRPNTTNAPTHHTTSTKLERSPLNPPRSTPLRPPPPPPLRRILTNPSTGRTHPTPRHPAFRAPHTLRPTRLPAPPRWPGVIRAIFRPAARKRWPRRTQRPQIRLCASLSPPLRRRPASRSAASSRVKRCNVTSSGRTFILIVAEGREPSLSSLRYPPWLRLRWRRDRSASLAASAAPAVAAAASASRLDRELLRRGSEGSSSRSV